ncbi:hypothetical protein PR048_019529 [Dryococelus australis]|uniref:Uncharacterized protein n=1 Tax=Dryococelus australis TaxID=614101 RepID=A0ABQ9H3Q5_9NEOP|nr:hypothetical protein PR048_019529 [Dryococelus australis]
MLTTLNAARNKLCPEIIWDFKSFQEGEQTTDKCRAETLSARNRNVFRAGTANGARSGYHRKNSKIQKKISKVCRQPQTYKYLERRDWQKFFNLKNTTLLK